MESHNPCAHRRLRRLIAETWRNRSTTRRFYLKSQRVIFLRTFAGDLLRLRLQIDPRISTKRHFEEEDSMSYRVYLYNIPKVSEDGKQSIPVPDGQVKEFNGVDDANMFAAGHKNNFDRVVLMQEDNEEKMIVVR